MFHVAFHSVKIPMFALVLTGITVFGAEPGPAAAPAPKAAAKRQVLPDLHFVPRAEFEQNFAVLKERLQGQGVAKVDPAMKIERTEQFDGFTRQTVSYNVEAGERVEGFLLIPDGLKAGEKRPLVLCLHGTNIYGKDAAVFDYSNPDYRTPDAEEMRKRRNRAFGYDLVRRGFICFAPDRPGFGKRSPVQPANGIPGMKAYEKLLAESRPGWSYNHGKAIHDLGQALDFLVLLPEVDAGNIGTIGHSLGGRDSMEIIAFDPRVKAAVVSCGGALRYREELWTSAEEQRKYATGDDINGQANNMNFFMQAAAPRPVLVMLALNDYLTDYPKNLIDGMRPIKMYYDFLLGGPKELEKRGLFSILVHTNGHDAPFEVRAYAYEWLERQLTGQIK